VKISTMKIMFVLGWIGVLCQGQAEGQHYVPYTVAQAEARANSSAGLNGESAGGSTQPNEAMRESPSDPAVMDQSPMIENGLWEGAIAGPGCAICGGGSDSPPPDWYTLQGVRVLSRSKSKITPFSFESPDRGNFMLVKANTDTYYAVNTALTPSVSNEVLDARTLGLGAAAGYHATIGHYLGRDAKNNDHFFEFMFWGHLDWSASHAYRGYMIPEIDGTTPYTEAQATLIANGAMNPANTGTYFGSLRTLFPTAPTELPGWTNDDWIVSNAFNYATEHRIRYRTTMNNFELNGRFSPRDANDRLVLRPNGRWQRECQPGMYLSYLYGFRYMMIDETFRFHSYSPWYENNVLIGSATGDYDVYAHNNMLGFQIGADLTFRRCRWNWGVEGKLGPYLNFADQISIIEASDTFNPGNVSRRQSAHDCQAAMIAEVGFQTTYKFRPNLIGRASYDFMWVTGVALAPQQYTFVLNAPGQLNHGGDIFSHGVSLGLEWTW